jgi:hypothetical protein
VFTHGDTAESVQEDFDTSTVTQILADFTDLDPVPRVELEFVRSDAPGRIPVRGQLVFAQAGVAADVVDGAT